MIEKSKEKEVAALEKELKTTLEGDVFFDSITRHVYSVDASIFEITPMGVVIPKTKQDLFHLIDIARHFQVPLIPRGAATGITGGCLGEGLIIDLSTFWNHILEIDLSQKFVLSEPGVTQDQLNHALAPHGYRLGPDTSTGNRATLGGMLANNAAGARSLRYGKMVDHVQAVEMMLSTGELLSFPRSQKKNGSGDANKRIDKRSSIAPSGKLNSPIKKRSANISLPSPAVSLAIIWMNSLNLLL